MNAEKSTPSAINNSGFLRLLDKIPHPLALLSSFAVLGMILTWIIPAGEYERVLNPVNNVKMVVAGSFQYLEASHPQGILEFLFSFWNGMMASGGFTVYLLLIGGAVSAISATGVIDAIIFKAQTIAKQRPGSDKVIIAGLALFFGFCGSTFGMSGETLIFLPMLVALCRSLKYDAIVAVALSTAAANLGYAAGTTNAFNIAIAQGIAELPIMSGIGFRFVWALVSFAITVWFILRYCKKIQANPAQSYVADVSYDDTATLDASKNVAMTPQRIAALVIFLGTIVGVVYGAVALKFGFRDLATLFLTASFLCAIVCRLPINTYSEEFAKGAATMVVPIMVLGIARSFLMLMQDGMIVDTIIHALVQPLEYLHSSLSVAAMVIFQGILNILIPAASGQAAISMPIMIPLGDLLEINRQVVVFAFQLGDGIGNAIIPTFGTLMAALAIAKVPYGRWFVFIGPLVILQFAFGIVFAIIADSINYGPF